MSHNHLIGGWTVASAIPLPALPGPAAEEADVTIALTPERPAIAAPRATGDNWTVAPGRWLVEMGPDEAIHVADGRDIALWSATGTPVWTPNLLPGSAFAVVAYMRGRLPLHGSALALPEGVVIILGQSGAGKSTLALALAKAGHRPMADDLCLPDWRCGQPVMAPVFPRLRAWPDTARQLGLSGELRPDGKVRLPLPDGLTAEPRMIRAVLVLTGRARTPRMERLRGAAACAALLHNRWAPHAADWYCGTGHCLAMAQRLAAAVPVLAVTTPDGIDRLTDFAAGLPEALKDYSVSGAGGAPER